MKRAPFEEGWDAGLRGYSDARVICPYEKMTKEYNEWHKFYAMATELRATCEGDYENKKGWLARLLKLS